MFLHNSKYYEWGDMQSKSQEIKTHFKKSPGIWGQMKSTKLVLKITLNFHTIVTRKVVQSKLK